MATKSIKTDLNVDGDIIINGTVDGIDVGTDVANNTTHRGSDGSDHSFIDQDVTDSASPIFNIENMTGLPASSKAITMESPTSSEDICMFYTPVAITITRVHAVVRGTTPSITIQPVHGTDRSTAALSILNVATAITSVTTGQTLTAFDDATVPVNSWVVFKTTAQSGAVDELCMTIVYTID